MYLLIYILLMEIIKGRDIKKEKKDKINNIIIDSFEQKKKKAFLYPR